MVSQSGKCSQQSPHLREVGQEFGPRALESLASTRPLCLIASCVCGLVAQSCPTLCDPMDYRSLLCPWNFPGMNIGEGLTFSSLGDLPDPGIEPGSPALQVDSLLSGIFLQCKRPGFSPWVGKIPWIREWQPTPVFLPREFHGQRSLAGYSPWGRRHD